ncbi:hypothetical protein JD514_15655 [Aeromonas caviae]|uniref:hypothetical protein n=1 Tax=Aeromonas caviae TaxID=648 RepID=UPI00191CD2B7|nr:hypothetical protein [Aeromonas caviae]MBL0498511.1 hypothetical protein [Aeromonas caviae]MCX4037417.1 hypothetical protein [Aeromonas caviae]
MSRKVIIFDTCVLCCWFEIPGKDTCGPEGDAWDHQRISDIVERERHNNTIFVLPLASIIEMGNHIAFANGDRYTLATKFSEYISLTAESISPWAAFNDQDTLWSKEAMKTLSTSWPALASQGIGIGDATIKNVAEFYSESGYNVELLTGDQGLKSHAPQAKPMIPRRRR